MPCRVKTKAPPGVGRESKDVISGYKSGSAGQRLQHLQTLARPSITRQAAARRPNPQLGTACDSPAILSQSVPIGQICRIG